jgi:hypothetical protein
MKHRLILKKKTKFDDLQHVLKNITFRGLYDSAGQKIKPYTDAKFSLAKVYPQKIIGLPAQIEVGKKREYLFTPQPTIYQNQIEVIETVHGFLKKEGLDLTNLNGMVEYEWEGRGIFHVLPPVIEKHTYPLKEGFVDLNKLTSRFRGTYARDACGDMHHLGNIELHNFHIDEVSKISHLDLFNSNAPIINYGLPFTGNYSFFIICDGAHRLDFVLEKLNKPITVIVVEPKHKEEPLIPYYAFPVPLRPTTRLSSKKAEMMFHRLERDKIHLLNDYIRKVLHYDWETAGLMVSKLRSNVDIY